MAQPRQIGRFEIHTVLGQGGMGTVYKAHDPLMDRWVAIKAITVQDAQQRARFQQEVRAAGRLNHPHIITVYDVGEEGELAYIVMELVEGETLLNYLSAPSSWPEAFRLLLPVCRALAYAHDQGVIHRDVKPANILVARSGQVKLTDFGVARLEAALRRITESGSTVGTPLYTAPEQLRSDEVDGRADLFSVGIILFELITGQHPFMGETLAQVVYRITQPEAVNLDPLVTLVPPSVVDVLSRALDKAPAARFAGAEEMAVALERCLDQPDVTLPPPPTPPTPAKGQSTSRPIIDIVPSNLHLSQAEENLLRTAFAGHDRIYLEREFSSGYSGARVLLVTPVRSGGRRLTQVILKLDKPNAIKQEWQAYQKYVKDTLPPVTARIMEAPIYAEDDQLALLRYTFAGGVGSAAPESLRAYYAHHSGEDVAVLLEKSVFRAFGTNWWLQRQTDNLILRREYDRLLPVHLVVAWQDVTETTSDFHTLEAGEIGADACRELEMDQMVQLQDFTVEEIEPADNELTLQALPPSGTSTNPIRIRIIGLPDDLLSPQVGETIPTILGLVTATRRHLLHQLAQSAWPAQDFEQKQLAIGGQLYPNPLYDYEALLDQRISTMRSIIHGDLNLQNILVTPTSGLAWLIDFATTHQGHNLYDFMRLETQVMTKLLPQTRASPEDVAHLMFVLHSPDASGRPLPADLQKPLAVLTANRRMVRVCMHNRENWDEYYLGLVLMLLGALKFKELDANARRLALAAAATARGLMTIPSLLHTPTPTPAPASPPLRIGPKMMGIAAAGLAILAILIGLGVWVMGSSPPPPETATPTSSGSIAGAKSSLASTATPFPTVTPSPTTESVPTPTALPPTPSPTVPPSPIPPSDSPTNCPPPAFYDSFPDDYPGLGCSIEAWESDFTYQQFERGLMVWRKSPDPSQIYVLAESGLWRGYEDPNGPPVPSCPEAQQTDDLGPIYGFGVIWCTEEMEQLGSPLSGEMEFKAGPVEQFEGGQVFRLDETPYLLFDNNKWVSLPPSPPALPPAPVPNSNRVVEDFEPYDTSALRQAFNLNNAGANEVAIEVITLADATDRGQVLAMDYEIKGAAPNNYVGLDRNLPAPQNWLDFEAVRMWLRNAGRPKTVVFQWGESQQQPGGGEVWRATFPLQAEEARFIDIPLTAQYFKRADWPEGGDNQMQLDQVSYYGFYIESTPGDGGTIYLDSIELVPGEAQTDVPPPASVACQIDPAPKFQALWDGHRPDLGCATDSPTTITSLVEESFEGGHLVWRGDTDEVYAIYDRQRDGTTLFEGQWEKPPQKWDGVSGCEGNDTPPPGYQKPERGFGWLWCTHLGGAAGPLGWALNKETPGSGQAQRFAGGLAFKGSSRKVYALLNDGRFLADQLDSAQAPPTNCTSTPFQPAEVFKPLWESLGGENGPLCYPLAGAVTDRNYARQRFERGFMFWWEAPTKPQPVWLIEWSVPLAPSGDTWTEYQDEWNGQWEYPPNCPNARPPLGPKRGFGLIWCYTPGVKEQIGRAIKEEYGSGNVNPKGAVQFFQGGLMFENPAEQEVWALIYGNGWYRQDY